MAEWDLLIGSALDRLADLPDRSIHTICTSPPYYGLRAYAGDQVVEWPEVAFYPMPGLAAFMPPVVIPAQRAALGSEGDLLAYVGHLVAIFRACRRVLRDDGVLWLNLGDSYNSAPPNMQNGAVQRAGYKASYDTIGRQDRQVIDLKPKDLIGVPWRVALALQADGWFLRSDVIWHKRSPMPESVTDRPTKAHEYVFLLAKSARYFYDSVAVAESSAEDYGRPRPFGNKNAFARLKNSLTGNMKEGVSYASNPTRNRRSVWSLASQPYAGAHFATWPPALVEPMILAGTSARGCCPACGAPWVRVVEREEGKVRAVATTGPHGDHGFLGKGRIDDMPAPVTTGWRPSCACDAGDPLPCVVLDPFTGSGTTGAVAVELGRRFVGIELSDQYADLASQRIGGAQPALFGLGVV